MAKVKLKVLSPDVGKLKLACELHNVTLVEKAKIIGEYTSVEANYRDPANLFEVGRTIDTIKSKAVEQNVKG